MPAAGVVMIIAVVAIVLALVYYLVSTILALRTITSGLDERDRRRRARSSRRARPSTRSSATSTRTSTPGSTCSRGCWSRRPACSDAVGLIDGLYPGAAAQGLRNFPESREVTPPRIGEVYTRGTLTLARLGREAPIAAASPNGPALRNPAYGSHAARALYPDGRPVRAQDLPRSPVIGADSPVQYDPDEEVGGPRKRMPVGKPERS